MPISQVKNLALANLEAVTLQPLKEIEPGVFVGEWTDSHIAARLSLPQLVRGMPVKGTPIAFTSTTGTFVVAGSDDPAGLLRAFELSASCLTTETAEQTLTNHPWILDAAGLKRWEVPSAHPLAAHLKTAHASQQQRS